jgi:hypothetical protein
MINGKYLAGGFLIAIGLSLGFGIGTLRAAGVPQDKPLLYSGTLTEDGELVTGEERNVRISLWTDETSTQTSDRSCETVANNTPIEGGRFRVALDSECVDAVHDEPEQWVEVEVGGTIIGSRAKLGAVPYALEAEHATNTPIVTDWAPAVGVTINAGANASSDLEVDNQTSEGVYRRVGDSIELVVLTNFSATPTTPNATVRWPFPAGIVFDEAKANRFQMVGTVSFEGVVCKAHISSSMVDILTLCPGGDNANLTSPVALTTGTEVTMRATFPVVGWSATE